MLSMHSNDNASNVVNFSSFDIEKEDTTFEETFLQLRFWLIESIHLISAGKMDFTETTKKNLRIYNRYCKMAGQEPLRSKFRK